MKKSNSKSKAQSAFWNLGAVALITATLAVCFTACKQTGGGGGKPKPTPKPKHAITFSVEGTNGKLKAKVEDIVETETSPINVEEGKTVTFTAEPSANYKVKEWKVGNTVVTGNKTNTYAHTVTKAVTVKVSFESNSNPPTPQTKYTVTLNKTEGGKVTASPEIPTDGKMPKDTVITFTAEANAGYKIGKWKVTPAEALQANTGTDVIESAKVKITADTTISVSFEAIPKHAITFSVESGNGTLKAKAYGVAETTTSPINVEEGKAVIFTATANSRYRVKGWTLDGNAVNGTAETYTLAVTQPATVKVSFEAIPEEAILTLSPDKLTIKVRAKTADSSAIEVEGCTVPTLASDVETTLTAKGTKVILKGKITELYCYGNKLTALNVQGLTVLQVLWCDNNELTELNVQGLTKLQGLYCYGNQLNAQAMTELLNALPAREENDVAKAVLYAEVTSIPEGNHKDYTQPADLKKAFDGAKSRNWKLQKIDASESNVDL